MTIQLEKILLSKPEAAQVLSISEKKLWSLTQPRGPIKAVRLGGRILYSPQTLRAFIRAEEERDGGEGSSRSGCECYGDNGGKIDDGAGAPT